MSDRLEVVTIDGPSGVGKSTISRMLAAQLGFTYLDTGAMYRGVALKCHQEGIDVRDNAQLKPLLDTIDLRLLPVLSEGEEVRVLLDGQDVSTKIRTPEMSMSASAVSALRPVRDKLTAMQQKMGDGGRVVAEGRDTGTVVFPHAAWKFYLDADPQERARRRIKQLNKKNEFVDEEEILRQIRKRDWDDSQRTIAPLQAAPDAVQIDSTRLTVDEVLERMLGIIRSRG